MHWGIAVGDGWLGIIEELCKQLEPYPVKFAQIKEKFGALRVYLDDLEEMTKEQQQAVSAAMDAAEELSSKTCEVCGAAEAKIDGPGWLRCLCAKCREERHK